MKTEFRERIESSWEELFPGEKTLPVSDLKSMLDHVGIALPNYKVRNILEELGKDGNATRLSKEEFEKLCENLDADNVSKTFRTTKQHDIASKKFEGHMGAAHFVLHEEEEAFADWINKRLSSDKDVNHFLPLSKDGSDMYEKMDDGVILCKMINLAAPDTIDERVLNKGKNISIFKRHENLTLAIKSAQAIGCTVIGMDSHNLQSSEGKRWMVMGLVWQVIKMFLFNQITISNVPGLVNLLREGEDISELMKLSPEQLLPRWVNHQLEKAGSQRHISNFSSDIKDSEIYTDLISQIAPKNCGVNKTALQRQDLVERAEIMLEQADKIDCRAFVTSKDVVKGQETLNLAFVANLFNSFPGLDPPAAEVDIIQETREEKMYRNWMNSLGVQPRVNYLYSDLYDGLVIFKIYDVIKAGTVNWDKVNTKYSTLTARRYQQVLENCNYAVVLGKKLNFVLVGIAGSDIMDGNKSLTLALVWQMMRAYTLSLLAQLNPDGTPIVESEIIAWANSKLEQGKKEISIKHFQDKANKTALPIIHLIDVIKPGSIDYSVVKQGANLSSQECLSNAKYAVNIARRIGAPVYALPEDISEVKHKMVMTVYASLMLADMN
jgi:plastin-3